MDTTERTTTPLPKVHFIEHVRNYVARVKNLLGKDIWELEYLGRKTVRARMYMLLRVLTLTFQGLRRNKIPVQAAALTFYSLIGLGPLIAIGIMVSGFVVDKGDENMVSDAISSAIAYAAPQLALEINSDEGNSKGLDPEMTKMIDNVIAAAQSGTVGVVGSLMLFVIGIQVLTSIEGSFNSLWGVAKGRKFGERVVTYWTFISLGAVIGAASLTLVTLPKILAFTEKLPFGAEMNALALFFSPVIAFLLITALLALFFRFIPNTQVNWKPAFTGAALVVVLLHLYNMLSFLYVQRVVDTRSLYGSVGIIVVLMLGLYVFWLLILLGGQVTYAVQNADYLTNENAWQKTSERSRELVSLAVLLAVAQRFDTGDPPIRASELHKKLRVPSHILNASISRLLEIGYLSQIEGKTVEEERDHAYQPGKPLGSISLGTFKQAFECYGNNDGADLVADYSPAIRTYLEEVLSLKDCPKADLKISELL